MEGCWTADGAHLMAASILWLICLIIALIQGYYLGMILVALKRIRREYRIIATYYLETKELR